MVNRLKDPNLGEECTEKLACKMGDMVNSSTLPSWLISKSLATDFLVHIVSVLLPEQSITKFTRSFRSVLNETDRSSCERKCKDYN